MSLQTGQFIRNTGVGFLLSNRGLYSTLIYTFYQKATGGNTDFQALDFDNRYFIPLNKHKARILALNLRSRYDFGQTPITSMISLGTSQDLRGLRFGQFRDYYANYLSRVPPQVLPHRWKTHPLGVRILDRYGGNRG